MPWNFQSRGLKRLSKLQQHKFLGEENDTKHVQIPGILCRMQFENDEEGQYMVDQFEQQVVQTPCFRQQMPLSWVIDTAPRILMEIHLSFSFLQIFLWNSFLHCTFRVNKSFKSFFLFSPSISSIDCDSCSSYSSCSKMQLHSS